MVGKEARRQVKNRKQKIGPPVPGISPCPGENRACDASIVCKTLQHTKRDSFGVPEMTLENDVCIIVRLQDTENNDSIPI
jgi:hypothetical protein